MKGYKLDRTLYIFDATPAAIPVSVDDVDVIYVQQELLAAYVNDNPDVASKIKPYNYKLLAVNKLPWADYIDNDLVEEPTEYTVSVNYGQTLLEYIPDGLEFEPNIPYSATEGTQLVFTLPAQTSWQDFCEGNTDMEHAIQIQYPESIQDSYEIVWPGWEDGSDDPDDPGEPIPLDGSLSFIMPAENVTLNIDLVENPYYIDPDEPVEPEEPEPGTVYNFLGYETEEAIEASSTGQITYEGEYSEDTNYVYGDAEVTFTGSDTPRQLTVYMTKDDFLTTLYGGRAQVFTLQDSTMTSIGYGELTEHVTP